MSYNNDTNQGQRPLRDLLVVVAFIAAIFLVTYLVGPDQTRF